MSSKVETVRRLRHDCLGRVPLTEATVCDFFDGSHSGTAEQCLKALCLSHERLRAELQGAEAMLAENAELSARLAKLEASAPPDDGMVYPVCPHCNGTAFAPQEPGVLACLNCNRTFAEGDDDGQ